MAKPEVLSHGGAADLVRLNLGAGQEALRGQVCGVGDQGGLVRGVCHQLGRLVLRLLQPGLCRTLGTEGVLVDVRGVDQQPSGLVVRGAGLGPHGAHLGLDIGPKVIGKVLRPGQQPEGCRAGLFGGRGLVA